MSGVRLKRHVTDTVEVFVDEIYAGYVRRMSPCPDCGGFYSAVRFDGYELGHNSQEAFAIRRLAPVYDVMRTTC